MIFPARNLRLSPFPHCPPRPRRPRPCPWFVKGHRKVALHQHAETTQEALYRDHGIWHLGDSWDHGIGSLVTLTNPEENPRKNGDLCNLVGNWYIHWICFRGKMRETLILNGTNRQFPAVSGEVFAFNNPIGDDILIVYRDWILNIWYHIAIGWIYIGWLGD